MKIKNFLIITVTSGLTLYSLAGMAATCNCHSGWIQNNDGHDVTLSFTPASGYSSRMTFNGQNSYTIPGNQAARINVCYYSSSNYCLGDPSHFDGTLRLTSGNYSHTWTINQVGGTKDTPNIVPNSNEEAYFKIENNSDLTIVSIPLSENSQKQK